MSCQNEGENAPPQMTSLQAGTTGIQKDEWTDIQTKGETNKQTDGWSDMQTANEKTTYIAYIATQEPRQTTKQQTKVLDY